MDFSDFMLPNSQSENVDFGSLAQQMMANLSGSGLDNLGTIEPVVTRSPASPTPMTRASNGSLLGDLAEEDEEPRSRPTSEQLIIDLSTPLKRASISSHRSSQRLSVHTLASERSERESASTEHSGRASGEQEGGLSEYGRVEVEQASDESNDEAFATPENKPSSIFETLGADDDAVDDGDNAGDDTVGDETILAELPPSPSQIM